MIQTRQQKIAAAVYERVQRLLPARPDQPTADEQKRKTDYGSMAHKLPMLIHNAGLIQALTFVQARGNDHHQLLLGHLAEVLDKGTADALVTHVRGAGLNEYMQLTQEAQQALIWFKRLAQSMLDVDAATEDDNG